MNYNQFFSGSLSLIFITLKLCHVITWSWLWVLSPIWILFLLAILILALQRWTETPQQKRMREMAKRLGL